MDADNIQSRVVRLARTAVPDPAGARISTPWTREREGFAGLSAGSLNLAMQAAVNPSPARWMLGRDGNRIGEGDPVIVVANDHGLGLLVGERMRALGIDRPGASLRVLRGGEPATLPLSAAESLGVAYATSYHKAQGDGPCGARIVIACDARHRGFALPDGFAHDFFRDTELVLHILRAFPGGRHILASFDLAGESAERRAEIALAFARDSAEAMGLGDARASAQTG